MLAAACGFLLLAAHPTSSPFGLQAEITVVTLAILAAALETASRFGSNLLLQDDFGQVGVAILLALMAPYRPALSLVIAAVASSFVLALFPVAQAPFLAVHAPIAEYIVVLVVPPLGLGLAAAAFSNGFVRAVREWQRLVSRAALEIEEEARTGLARSVQQQPGQRALPRRAAVPHPGDQRPHRRGRGRRDGARPRRCPARNARRRDRTHLAR